jgi:hypothetical protein
MGKEGLRLVLKALNEEGVMKEDARQAAEYYLENYRFIYENPDDLTVRYSSLFLFVLKPLDGTYLRATRGLF